MFICSIAVLLHYENYEDIYNILTRTYFLNENPVSQNKKPFTFIQFRPTHRYIDENIKPRSETPNLFTLAGDIVVKREKQPIITQTTVANADVVLYQLSEALGARDLYSWSWFPILYCYLGGRYSSHQQDIWSKMISMRYCESLYPLFGVHSKEELIKSISRNKSNEGMRYSGDYHNIAPLIKHSIKIDEIGTMP